MQVDHYIKMIKDLSYNELVDLSNSMLSTCNDYINDLYNDTYEENNMDKKLEARIARLEKLAANESCSTKCESDKVYVNFYELSFFDPELKQTLGFDRVYDIAKAATEYIWQQQKKTTWGDPAWVEKLKLASALNPKNNPIFDEFCKSMDIDFNDLDNRTARLLNSAIRRVLGKYATAHLRANNARMSRDDRKSYFSKSKQEKLLSNKHVKNEWVRKHPDGMKLAEEAEKLSDLILAAHRSAEDLKKHLDSYTEEANLGFDVPSKEQISKTLDSTINSLEEIMWMFKSSDYYKAFGDERGFEMM